MHTLKTSVWAMFVLLATSLSLPGQTFVITNNFNGMTTNIPVGWYLLLPSSGQLYYSFDVIPSSGDVAVNVNTFGFSLGTSGSTERALGVGPTGGDRYIMREFYNNTPYVFGTIAIQYTGEQWRTGTASNSTLVLQFSYEDFVFTNMGSAFNFTQLVSSTSLYALDGNNPTNRVTGIGGTYQLSTPIRPNTTFYIRWYDFNDSGTDPVLAIDDVIFTLIATNLPNNPPTIAITNVFGTNIYGGVETGSVFLVGSRLSLEADITDDNNSVTNVEWLVNGTTYVNNLNDVLTLINPLAGTYALTAVASDAGGLRATSAPVTITITNPPGFTLLVTNGASWLYFSAGSEPPWDATFQIWNQLAYDDSGWSNGLAELGSGDSADYPEKTVIDIGPAGNRYAAAYFRKHFTVADPAAFANLAIHLLRDDGAVVYLNGTPVWTNNMPNAVNGLYYAQLAATANDDGTLYQTLNLVNPSAYLVAGDNVVAVEVHQSALTSSDLSFDLMLWGETLSTPTVTITSPTNGQAFVAGQPVTVTVLASMHITSVELLLDDITVAFGTNPPFSMTLSNLTAGSHNFLLIGYDRFGQVAFTPMVTFEITPDQPPSLAFVSAVSVSSTGTNFLAGTTITNQWTLTDDNGVTNVDYYIDGEFSFRNSTAPFGIFVVNNALAGIHQYTAVAADTLGQTNGMSVTVTITNPPYALLITNGSTWKYFSTATNPGFSTQWLAADFDDSSWASGFGALGNDSAPDWQQRTYIDIGPAGIRYPTIYFRKTFAVADPLAFSTLAVNVMRDDGAVVYLNGVQVFATSFALNTVFPVSYSTLAANAADNGTLYFSTNISASALRPGTNVIAVEVHQSAVTSSDLNFDLMLWGISSAGPQLVHSLANASLKLAWPESANGYTLQSSDNVAIAATNWPAFSGPYATNNGWIEVTIPTTEAKRFFHLRK